ncbi:MAG: hypothetical protein Q9220_003224 [cf. Caloplaca sp. 1 TL-2023]
MSFIRQTVLIFALSTALRINGDTTIPQVTWLFPDNGTVQTYSQNDILNASWITSLTMMPTLISLCQESKSTGTSNISYSYVHSMGSKMVPLDLWTGLHYPYICKLDFIDGVSNQPLNQPSNPFMIAADTANSPSKIWSQGHVDREVQAMSVTNATATSGASSSPPTNTSAVHNSASAGGATAPVSSTRGSGLSTGAMVGIVIAALISGALVAGGSAVYWIRRRGDKQSSIESSRDRDFTPSTTTGQTMNGWVTIQEKDSRDRPPEMDNTVLTELGSGKAGEHMRYS